MGKKRLIAAVTFLAGLYYFLEFVVPPTVPWRTVRGRVQSATPRIVSLKVGGTSRGVPIDGNTLVFRDRSTGPAERITASALHGGDTVTIGPGTYLSDWITGVNSFFVVLTSMAWGMGLLSLWMVHSSAIRKRKEEWYGSVVFFVTLAGGVMAGLGYGAPGGWLKQFGSVVVDDLITPMTSTVFSVLAFYMASAAYRCFRVRSWETLCMMVSALIVMLGQIPIGFWLTHSLPRCMWLPEVSQWVLYVANSAAVRGMYFGMMLGAIAVGLRFWLSLERGAFFDKEL